MATDYYAQFQGGPPAPSPLALAQQQAMAQMQAGGPATAYSSSQAGRLIQSRLAQMQQSAIPPVAEVPISTLSTDQMRAMAFPQQPRALEAGPMPLNGPGIPVNSAGVVNPATSVAEAAPPTLASTPAATQLSTAPLESAAGADVAAATQLAPSLGSKLGNWTGLGAAARAASVPEGAAVPGVIGTLAGRLPAAGGALIGGELAGMATKLLGPAVLQGLGIHVQPGSLEAGATAGADVGKGAAIGALIGGGLPGAAIGGLAGGLKDLAPLAVEEVGNLMGGGTADKWKSTVSAFDKTIMSYKHQNLGKDPTGGFATPQDYVNNTYLPAAQKIMDQARAGQLSHEAAISKLATITNAMKSDYTSIQGTWKTNKKAAAAANKPSKSDARLAIQMGQAMGELSDSYLRSAYGAAQQEQAQAAAQPGLAPVLNADAASREAYAVQMAGAFKGAAMVQPTINKMDQQIALQQQILQQIYAAQNARQAASSGGGAQSLSSLTNQSQQQANSVTAAQAQQLAQLGQ